ncbi:MAG: O-antigen ligase family protein [Anaerolineae bacterium]|nr:O-antigen ligase family protein [Anaerolineae bacterium]NUQ06065.1 O-antigen ligase family protein [Anaerolineae bacterium]
MNMQQAKPLSARDRAVAKKQQHDQRAFWLDIVLDSPVLLTILGAAHFVLAFYVRESQPGWSALHSLIPLAVGLYFATNRRVPVIYAAYMAAYIAGCEVMWRQNEFAAFWESGKIYSSLILFAAWVRDKKPKLTWAPALYLLALLPGILLTVVQLFDVKSLLSSNATGPVSLFIMVAFFSTQRLSSDEVRRLFTAFALPVVGIAGIVIYRVNNLDIAWTGDSNNETSGFGANQVSTAISMAWFFLAAMTIVFFSGRQRALNYALAVGTAIWMVVAAFFTFSRGGLIGSGVALIVMMVLMLGVPSRRMSVAVALAGVALFFAIIFPSLDNTTQGYLAARYNAESPDQDLTTHRARLIQQEIQVFLKYPITGVGVGQGKAVRDAEFDFLSASHTEYTRLLAEHGILGVGANILIVIIAFQAFRKQETWQGRALSLSLIAWGLIYMSHAAMRTVEPSLAIGLACAVLAVDMSENRIIRREDYRRLLNPRAPAQRIAETITS